VQFSRRSAASKCGLLGQVASAHLKSWAVPFAEAQPCLTAQIRSHRQWLGVRPGHSHGADRGLQHVSVQFDNDVAALAVCWTSQRGLVWQRDFFDFGHVQKLYLDLMAAGKLSAGMQSGIERSLAGEKLPGYHLLGQAPCRSGERRCAPSLLAGQSQDPAKPKGALLSDFDQPWMIEGTEHRNPHRGRRQNPD
jgi:hypothetical protein